MSSLKVSIYSLRGNLINEEAETVVIPGYSGDIGVISGDRLLTYLIKPGIIYFIKGEKSFKRLFIFNGRFLANNNTLTITTEYDVVDLDNITKPEIEKRVRVLQDKVNSATNEADKKYYENHLQQEYVLLGSYNDKLY